MSARATYIRLANEDIASAIFSQTTAMTHWGFLVIDLRKNGQIQVF
jgi:hypothetical protein